MHAIGFHLGWSGKDPKATAATLMSAMVTNQSPSKSLKRGGTPLMLK